MKLYGEFAKVEDAEDGTLRVEGFASSEAVDCDGETIKAEAMRAAIPDYMAFGAVREMHQPLAAGTALEMAVEDDGRTRFVAHVVDPVAVKKVKAGVYKGFSIGGKVTGRDPLAKTTITGLRLTEVSLVDRPANPAATFTMFKADVRADDEDATSAPDDAPVEDETVQKGLWSVASFADLVQQLQFMAQDSAFEASYEGDASPVPAKMKALLADAAGLLVTMAGEESAEAVASVPDPEPAAGAVTLAEATGDLAKAEGGATPEVQAEPIAKAGARHSQADVNMIQSMHDTAVGLGATCASDEADKVAKVEGDAVAKLAGELAEVRADLAKAAGENERLTKRVTELEALPAAPKGVLRHVAKGEDVASATPAPSTDVTDADDALSAIRKVHQSGGVRLR